MIMLPAVLTWVSRNRPDVAEDAAGHVLPYEARTLLKPHRRSDSGDLPGHAPHIPTRRPAAEAKVA
jgi:hypothetical protein